MMKLTLDPGFYTRHAVDQMTQEFAEYLEVECSEEEGMCLNLNVKEPVQADSTLIMQTFLNNILELSIQELVIRER